MHHTHYGDAHALHAYTTLIRKPRTRHYSRIKHAHAALPDVLSTHNTMLHGRWRWTPQRPHTCTPRKPHSHSRALPAAPRKHSPALNFAHGRAHALPHEITPQGHSTDKHPHSTGLQAHLSTKGLPTHARGRLSQHARAGALASWRPPTRADRRLTPAS